MYIQEIAVQNHSKNVWKCAAHKKHTSFEYVGISYIKPIQKQWLTFTPSPQSFFERFQFWLVTIQKLTFTTQFLITVEYYTYYMLELSCLGVFQKLHPQSFL